MRSLLTLFVAMAIAGVGAGCANQGPLADDGSNPFLDVDNGSKEDTAYQNPDGIEVEVDFEADVQAPSYKIFDAPADLGQYAVTYLRTHGEYYLESIAEAATSADRVEWQVNGEWVSAQDARSLSPDQLTHFRIRGMDAVLLHSASNDARIGAVTEVPVPVSPYSVMADAGDKCAEHDAHLGLSQSIYWYMWKPDAPGCDVATQQATVTITQTFPSPEPRYPEYDRLVEDGVVTAVVIFGQIGEGDVENDSGVWALQRMARNLMQAGFAEAENAPLGRRFTKTVGDVELQYDLYPPSVFSGLGDYGHFANFQTAISEHEIVAYDGHSMLGASDFWARPEYPGFYQIFLYGGCLGYEYYVQPILRGKGGWDNVDIMSSVVEVSADANYFAAPVLAKLEWALAHGNAASWADMLRDVRRSVGDSTFGVSGVGDNCYTPSGSRCGNAPPPPPDGGETHRYESTESVDIPDNDPAGVSSTIEVTDDVVASAVSVEIDLTHTYVGDLRIEIEHDGATTTVWSQTGGSQDDIHQTFTLAPFAGAQMAGTWKLTVSDNAAIDTGTLNGWALVAAP